MSDKAKSIASKKTSGQDERLKEVSKDIKELEKFITEESYTNKYENSISVMDGLFDKLSEISGMDEFLNSVDDLLSMVDSDELDPMAIRTKSKEVVELFNREVSWRANAKENLMPKQHKELHIYFD